MLCILPSYLVIFLPVVPNRLLLYFLDRMLNNDAADSYCAAVVVAYLLVNLMLQYHDMLLLSWSGVVLFAGSDMLTMLSVCLTSCLPYALVCCALCCCWCMMLWYHFKLKCFWWCFTVVYFLVFILRLTCCGCCCCCCCLILCTCSAAYLPMFFLPLPSFLPCCCFLIYTLDVVSLCMHSVFLLLWLLHMGAFQVLQSLLTNHVYVMCCCMFCCCQLSRVVKLLLLLVQQVVVQ